MLLELQYLLVRQADPTGTLPCTEFSAIGFPCKNDCEDALAKASFKPQICTNNPRPNMTILPVRTCKIQKFNSLVKSHCLNHGLISKGGIEILANCNFISEGPRFTGGQYEWPAGENGDREGVRFIKIPFE